MGSATSSRVLSQAPRLRGSPRRNSRRCSGASNAVSSGAAMMLPLTGATRSSSVQTTHTAAVSTRNTTP